MISGSQMAGLVGEIMGWTFVAWLISRLFSARCHRFKAFISYVLIAEIVLLSIILIATFIKMEISRLKNRSKTIHINPAWGEQSQLFHDMRPETRIAANELYNLRLPLTVDGGPQCPV
jgi:hypothetical protein